MRLSEAIRIGASWSKQTRMFWKNEQGTCALGSAYEGTFGEIHYADILNSTAFIESLRIKLEEKYPYMSAEVKSPFDGRINLTLSSVMWRLNDVFLWSREQIADWVEKLENENGWTGIETPKEAVIPQQQPVAV